MSLYPQKNPDKAKEEELRDILLLHLKSNEDLKITISEEYRNHLHH
jgi:hypothetical protein